MTTNAELGHYPHAELADDATTAMGVTSNDRLAMSWRSFDAVIGAYRGYDENAARILTGLAFLTAASVALLALILRMPTSIEDLRSTIFQEFGPSLSATEAEELDLIFDQYVTATTTFDLPFASDVSVPILAFACYLLFALIATAFYLAVIWPSIEEIDDVGKDQTNRYGVTSRLFYREISKTPFNDWKSHWESHPELVQSAIQADITRETYLLSHRAMDKERLAKWGSWAFRAALVPLIILSACLFLPDVRAFTTFAPIAVTVLCVAYIVEASLYSSSKERRAVIVVSAVIILSTWWVFLIA